MAGSGATLEGRVAIVTGAAGAIGSQVSRVFSAQGCRLMLADTRPGSAILQAVGDLPQPALAETFDVTNSGQIADLVAKTIDHFGRVDILVNVAGVVSFGSAASVTVAEWDRVLGVNLKGTFFSCQAVMPQMRRQHYGRIINIGSVIGKNGGNARPWIDPAEQIRSSNVAYGISKAGVHALTFFLARELAADGITVNAVAPGPIASGMTVELPPSLRALIPVGRIGQPDDVAQACLFLAAETSSFITAEVLDVNGGSWGD